MTPREIALKIIWHYLGTPYRWGGDDPSSFDCSGLVIEALQSAGVFPRKADDTAEGLRQRYREISTPDLQAGDLCFWLSGEKAIHVGMLVAPGYYIGAEGGGSSTITVEDAWARNAFVKVRPIESRGSEATRRFADPFAVAGVGS